VDLLILPTCILIMEFDVVRACDVQGSGELR
jgi:hypothetical protein